MTRAKMDGMILLVLGSLVFVAFGWVLESTTPKSMNDFKATYYATKCLLAHCDPYDRNNLTRFYHAEEGARSTDSAIYRTIATTNVYLPSSLFFMLPFAFLHYGPAHLLWMALIAASFLLAAFLIWDVAADISPVLAGFLVGFHLANSELLIFTGNPAGIAVSLSIVAAWCFVRERFEYAGILCMAASVAIKPQDAGLIWLFFLLAGGIYRKRALQTLVLVIALALPMAAWVTYLSPHWMLEVKSSLVQLSARGAMNDPGPASSGGHDLAMITDLQTVISELWGQSSNLQSDQLSHLRAASAGLDICNPAQASFRVESMVWFGGHCGAYHAANLSPAIRRKAYPAHGSRLHPRLE